MTENTTPAPEDPREQLGAGARTFGLALSESQLDQFMLLLAELLNWNERVNLTAITTPAGVITRHFLDSLATVVAAPRLTAGGPTIAIDVGTGPGFPGLPLAIAFPTLELTLLESTGKKTAFLTHIVAALGLSRVTVVQGRAEDVARQREHRARYDLVLSRAVAALPVLLEYTLPFCRPGGRLVAHKKLDIADELAAGRRAATALGGGPPRLIPVTVPGLDDDRALVVVEQRQPCPERYPRAGAAIAKRPLG